MMEGNTKDTLKFLKLWEPEGPWHIVTISPDKQTVLGRNCTTIGEAETFVDEHNGKNNLYFTVNRIMHPKNKKCFKTDIKEAQWLHVDIDPDDKVKAENMKEEQDRLLSTLTTKIPKGIPSPTCIIFSGGGLQAFWKLNKPIIIEGKEELWEDFELYNRRLSQIFGGDKCHNVDRIMRLPGTINVPDAKKRKRGRVDTEAKLLKFDKKCVYKEEEFKKAQAVQTAGASRTGGDGAKVTINGEVERIMDLSELDEWNVPDRIKMIIAQGHHPDQPKEGDNSRSAWLFDCVCGLARHQVPDEIIYSILTDPEWLISSSVVELKGGADRYAIRQISRAKEYVVDPTLVEMNDKHAVIGNIGGKCRVIEEIEDDFLHRSKLTITSFEDLRNRYSNRKVVVGVDKDGADCTMALGKWWLAHPMRRQYDTMKFMPQGERPGVYNLWRGFSVEAVPGNCDLYLQHIRDNICLGNEDYYSYLINWMARTIQFPASRGEVAIVLRGGKGTGKGVFARTFGRLFGRHHIHIANAKHLIGNFNSHLKDAVSVFADEAFFAGDKQHESVLKMLITEDTIPIEMKGIDIEIYPNYVHLIMASNDPHVIRATGDERRYFVLSMGEDQKQNAGYFQAIDDQMENGGYEALLFHLQSLDLSDFRVQNVPQTEALKEQKLYSMGIDEEWWYRKLENGRILENDPEWTRDVSCEILTADFTKYADKWNFSRRGNETALGRFISRIAPHVEKTQRRVAVTSYDDEGRPARISKRVYFYDFGTLDKCRKAWDEIYGETNWPDPVQLDLDQPGDVPF